MTEGMFLNETLNPSAWREVVDALYGAGRHKDASRFKECGVSVKIYCSNCGETKKVPYYCMRRYCPQCARRYSNKIQLKLYKRLKGLRAFENSESRYKLRMITLTIRTDGDYAGALCKVGDSLPKLWRNLLARDNFGRKIGKGGDVATGWINSIELGPKTLNVHVHGVYWGSFIRQQVLSEEWKRLTGSCVVDIRITDNKSLREVVKYASNTVRSAPKGVSDIFHALRTCRKIQSVDTATGQSNNHHVKTLLSFKKQQLPPNRPLHEIRGGVWGDQWVIRHLKMRRARGMTKEMYLWQTPCCPRTAKG